MSRTKWAIVAAVVLGLLGAWLAFGREEPLSDLVAGASDYGGGAAPTQTPPQGDPYSEPATSPEKEHSHEGKEARVDLNSASREVLLALPGLDPATVDRIIAARPLSSVQELLTKGLLTDAQFKRISSRVMVKPTPGM